VKLHTTSVSAYFLVFLVSVMCLISSPMCAGKKETRLSEQTIYVPYDKLEKIFEKEGRGVFLPYKEFIELWTQLTPALGKPPEEKPPVDGVLIAAEYKGKVEGKVALIEAHLEFRALKKGYTSVPLGADGLAISEVVEIREELDKKLKSASSSEAFLANVKGKTTAILPGPGSYHFTLNFMIPVIEEPGRKLIRWNPPATSISRFQLDVPDQEVEFKLKPAAAYTQEKAPNAGTRLSAFFGAAKTIEVAWVPRRVVAERDAVYFADLNEKVSFQPGSTRCDAEINLTILLSGLSEIKLLLPSQAQVLNVGAANLKSWDSSTDAAGQTVTVQLHTPAKGSLKLTLSCEMLAASIAGERDVPVVRVKGVQRQSGNILIYADSSLELSPLTTEGVSQESTPKPKRGPHPLFAYRYLKIPYQLSMSVKETQPRIEAVVHTLAQAGLDRWVVQTRIDYEIKKAGLFTLSLQCPMWLGDTEITDGKDLVEDYRTTQENGTKVQLELKNKTTGKFSISLRNEIPWKSPDEIESTTRTIPFFHTPGANRVEGYLGLSVHESLRVNTVQLGGVRSEDVRSLGKLPAPDKTQATAMSLGFRYRDESEAPTVLFKRRKPRVSCVVASLVEVREAFLKLTATLTYQVDYAGMDEFSFQLPATIADDVHINGQAIKERIKEVSGELATWKIKLQNKQLGSYVLSLDYESPYAVEGGAAAEKTSKQKDIPRISPTDVFRQTGYLALLRDGNLEVNADVEGLEAIDNKELPGTLQKPGVFLAYKYERGAQAEQKPWKASLAIVRHAYVEVPAAIVNLAALRTVITEEGHQTCELTYMLQNKRAQYLELDLPKGARILSDILVGDKVEQPSQRESDGKLLIRLRGGADPNQEIAVQLVYELKPDKGDMGLFGKIAVTPPKLEGTKILQTWWSLYLPQDYDYPRFKGAMREPLPGTPGWHRWRRVVDWAIPRAGFAAPRSRTITPRQGEVAAAGLNVKLVAEGKRFRLHRLAEPSDITIQYRKRAWTLILEIFAFVIAIVLGMQLVKRAIVSRVAYCATAGVLAVLMSVLVAPRAAGPCQWFYLGVLLLAVFWIIKALRVAWINRPRKPKSAPVPPAAPAPPVPVKEEAPKQENKREEKSDE
jgi:hypothetical protein